VRLRKFCIAVGLAMLATAIAAEPLRPDQASFRALYKELVETNTTQSAGSCSLAAERMAARLKAAGYPDRDLHLFSVPAYPKDGGLVAVLPGSDSGAKAILLLAHLDVVEAKREDWQRDPFRLVEENGLFYGRGTTDDKTQAAIWTDSLIRLRQEGIRPLRTVKMALTCGEEGGRFNGAQWLAENRRDLIDAAFALNEGGWGTLDEDGKPQSLAIEAGEKTYEDYRLEVTNPGGHSSRPVKDNAITRLARALIRVESYQFPIQFVDANRAFFGGLAKQLAKKGDVETAQQMTRMVADANDVTDAEAVAAKDPSWNATLRTTCVATMLDGGHARNALPQRAGANINCRIFPGVSASDVQQRLATLIDDPAVTISTLRAPEKTGPAPPLTPQVVGPAEKLMGEMWPGVPVLPILQAGATDGRFLNEVGIPTYGIDGSFTDRALNNIHGLNEHAGVDSLYKDRDFLYQLIKIYSAATPGS